MSNLQPLKWRETSVSASARTPIHSYEVIATENNKFYVKKVRLETQKLEEVTGFDTAQAAKDWCFNEHYAVKMQPYVKPDSITDIADWFNNFTQWSYDRQIIQNGNVLAQGLKLVSEVGELADNLAKGRDIKDDIGDCMVVLNNLVHMTGVTLDDCLAQAWGDIKDRTGTMNEHGVFIKDSDVG